jgi:hypothetical protein
MKHRFIACGLVLIVALCGATPAKAPSTKEGDIRKLIDVVGGGNLAVQMASMWTQGVMQAYRAANPDMPERAAVVIEKEITAMLSEKMNAKGGFMDQVVPIYDKYFTHAEIKDLLGFYETPTGKKAISVLPQVMNESAQAGQAWGQSLAVEADARIKAALRKEKLIPAN